MLEDYEFGRDVISSTLLVDIVSLPQPRKHQIHRCVRKASYPGFDVRISLIPSTGRAAIETNRCVAYSILSRVDEHRLWIVFPTFFRRFKCASDHVPQRCDLLGETWDAGRHTS